MKALSTVMMVVLALSFAVSASAQTPEELLVASIVPLSGAPAAWGLPQTRGAEVCVEDLNKAGGLKVGGKIYKLKHKGYDHKLDASETVSAARKAISDGAVMVNGQGGAVVPAMQTITEPAGVIIVAVAGGGCRVVNPQNPLTFQQFAALAMIAERTTNEFVPFFQPQKAAILQPDDDLGRETGEHFKKYLSRAYPKVELAAEEYFSRAMIDFYPVLGRIIPRKIDYIFSVNASQGTLALIAKQSRELGYSGPIIGATDVTPSNMIKIAGEKNLDLVVVRFFVRPPTPLFAELDKRYVERYREQPTSAFQDGYEDVRLWARAVEKARTLDSKVIAETLANSVYTAAEYMKGPAKWTDFGCGIKRSIDYPMEMAIFEGGKVYDWWDYKKMKKR